MDFTLSEDQLMLQRTIREFALAFKEGFEGRGGKVIQEILAPIGTMNSPTSNLKQSHHRMLIGIL